MNDMNSGKKSYEPGANDDISSVIDHGQDGLNPKKSIPLQLTISISVGVLLILTVASLYYYGFFS
ncbi:MAG: hypothetical protein KME06_11685 [Kastovskya adunca ATA6-11-RM4]|jgi:hypothetical protein|nr:hypothetical protein [Kastovskya adunca ATA6-11-RM4]